MRDQIDATIIVFSKEQVRHGKLAHFLKRFGTDALPDRPELAKLMGSCQFLIQGWDQDNQWQNCSEPLLASSFQG